MFLTAEQILTLAPDAASAKAGTDLAAVRKWATLGRAEGTDVRAEVIWGECQGSGKTPYRTQIDTSEPAFKCSCPSRKFPCKHALALFMLRANQPASFASGAPPAWVTEWIAAWAQKQEAKQKKEAGESIAAKSDPAAIEAAAAKRIAARERKIAAGLAELELWLRDIVRRGLASAQGKPPEFWEAAAARLVDAQAPGAARMVRALGNLPTSGEGWEKRLLERISLLHLLVEGYKRQSELSPEQRADVRALIGWTVEQEEVRTSEGVHDEWIVVGRVAEDEDRLRVERTWLYGASTDRVALVLNFTPLGQMRGATITQDETVFVPGEHFVGDIAYFPGAYPLRAVVKEQRNAGANNTKQPGETFRSAIGYATLTEATDAYAAALTRNPWLERFPIALRAVTPQRTGSRWIVRDESNCCLPLAERFTGGWKLLAQSGGRPLWLFGEWDGRELLPLSARVERGFQPLT